MIADPGRQIEQWPIGRLKPYARNARTHSPEQVAQIAASIREWGWTMPILVDDEGGVIAGHARLQAAQSLELASVPVVVARGWNDAQRRAYVLADNKLAENAGWDFSLLRDELADLDTGAIDIGLIGFSDAELEQIATWTPTPEPRARRVPGADPDAVPPVSSAVTSARGDLWVLGEHRVMCGEATSVADVERLIRSDRTGNPLHPTQKPVDLLQKILDVSDMVKSVYDPFAGSGSILMACEAEARRNFSMELEPAFVDVIVNRWQQFTGRAATLDGDGRTFDEITASRHRDVALAAD